MDYTYQIYRLSAQFAKDYPSSQYPELLHKNNRPYTCLLIETKEDYFICVPFRSDINHNNAYLFKNSVRSRSKKSGLDYSKIVIIKDNSYLDNGSAVVDADEYAEMVTNINKIVNDVNNYVTTYIDHIKGVHVLHPRQYNRLYKYSSLPYFNKFF